MGSSNCGAYELRRLAIKLKELLVGISKRCPGGKLPDSYLVFDTETSGVDIARDRILQFGFVLVKNNKIQDQYSFLVKRTKEEVFIHPEALKVHGITYERLEREGVLVSQVIDDVIELFEAARRVGMMFVGHNIFSFDSRMLERECILMGKKFKFGDDEIVDTGMIVKAAQIGVYIQDGMTLRDWALRVADIRARGVMWSLDRYCIPTYDLNRFGPFKSHDAMGDCQTTHHLLGVLKTCLND